MKKASFTKTIFGLLILSLFSVSSCKKNSDNPSSSSSNYYIKFKIDETEKNYSSASAAKFTTLFPTSPVYSVTMKSEYKNGTTFFESMAISIFDNQSIAENVTYTDKQIIIQGGTSQTSQANLAYNDGNGGQSGSGFTTNPNVKVIITKLDDKTVSGTFSGVVASTIDRTSTQTVTEGQFYLPRQ